MSLRFPAPAARPTEARRSSLEDSLAFEQVHERVYRDLGLRLIDVPAAALADRVALILPAVSRPQSREPGKADSTRLQIASNRLRMMIIAV